MYEQFFPEVLDIEVTTYALCETSQLFSTINVLIIWSQSMFLLVLNSNVCMSMSSVYAAVFVSTNLLFWSSLFTTSAK